VVFGSPEVTPSLPATGERETGPKHNSWILFLVPPFLVRIALEDEKEVIPKF